MRSIIKYNIVLDKCQKKRLVVKSRLHIASCSIKLTSPQTRQLVTLTDIDQYNHVLQPLQDL